MTSRALRRIERRNIATEHEPYTPALEQVANLRAVVLELQGKVDDAESHGPAFQAWRDASEIYRKALADAARLDYVGRLDELMKAHTAELSVLLRDVLDSWLVTVRPQLKDTTSATDLRRELHDIFRTKFQERNAQ